MYKSIQVEDFDFSIFPSISYLDVSKYREKNENRLIKIQDYLLDRKNTLSVDKISENLFLDIKPDIFLSHSHADENDAIRLAILIEKELKLNVFIDSCIWGDAFKLLRKIDNIYSLDGDTFDYHIRNHTTSNIFMILNSALHRIIDNCEAFIFLGTDKSIPITDTFEDKKYLSSPWIYSELQFAKLVRRTKPRRISFESRDIKTESAFDSAVDFAYSIPMTDAALSNRKLRNWIEDYQYYTTNRNIHPLDTLYKAISYR
ncbi:hypothetical protein OHW01_18325 [Acinetobacter baumannii]|uniref:hypothetical protein n=1 Tax=Acinetobacter TaxID=469 RepID=UPI000BF32709|nr:MULTISPECIES: hypothetical protein [Acinetobacter]MDC4876282.1 hypothetical protein [Acinetobacter baumannii]MDC4887041.1 hypothetical protein [Acinetobacter baumannii]MDC4925887.1 hypothetical protein [Acinetobacter baumannii]MDC4940583.1 hypothetical protein [Acinetobacter baumannii]MDC4945160.1 hypothetical protein [Acinetobacter baumannii]